MAATSSELQDSTCVAAVDLTGSQFRCVQITGNRQVNLLTNSSGQIFFGVLQNRPKAGEGCDVAIFGVTKLIAGGTLVAGAQMMVDSGGRAVAWVSGNLVIGVAMESAVVNQVFAGVVVSALN